MAKELALICIDDPSVRAVVEKLGEQISRKDVSKLLDMGVSCPDNPESPWYCPIVYCDEGSIVHQKFVQRDFRDEYGRNYSIVKEVVAPVKKGRGH